MSERGSLRVLRTWIALGALLAPAASLGNTYSLEDIVRMAQEAGLDARSARGNRDQARWEHRSFEAGLWPQVRLTGMVPSFNQSITQVVQPDGTTSFVRQSQRYTSLDLTVAQPVPAVGGELLLSSGLSRLDLLGGVNTHQWQAQPMVVGWRQQIFQPRRLVWDGRESAARTLAAEQRYRESMEDIAAAATAAFFDVYSARLGEENALANAAVNDTLYVLSRGRYEVGKIGENDLLQSELALLRSQAAVDAARLERERAHERMRLLVNLPEDAPLQIADPPPPLEMSIDTALVAAEALRNQSRIKESDLALLSARRRVSEARMARLPSATLAATVGLDQTARDFRGAYRDPRDHQQLSLAFDLPVWQWGAGSAEVRAAAAGQASRESEAALARREVAQEARFAAREFDLTRRQLALAAKADTVATKRFEVTKNRYVIGRISVADLYLAQNEKDAALLAYVQAVRGYWLAYYRVRRLTLYDFAERRPIAG